MHFCQGMYVYMPKKKRRRVLLHLMPMNSKCIAQPSPHSQRTDLIAVVRNRTYYFLSGSYSDQIVLFLFYLFVRFVPCLNGMTFLPETESWFPPAFSQDIFGPFKFEKIKKKKFPWMKETKINVVFQKRFRPIYNVCKLLNYCTYVTSIKYF